MTNDLLTVCRVWSPWRLTQTSPTHRQAHPQEKKDEGRAAVVDKVVVVILQVLTDFAALGSTRVCGICREPGQTVRSHSVACSRARLSSSRTDEIALRWMVDTRLCSHVSSTNVYTYSND